MKKTLSSILHKLGLSHGVRHQILHSNPFKDKRRIFSERGMSPKIILDIGAFDGRTAVIYNKYFPHAKIYAFEPFPESFERLRELQTTKPNIKPIMMAVDEICGKKRLFVNDSTQTNSFYPSSSIGNSEISSLRSKKILEVDTTSLDSFVKEQKAESVDILKIDVQGAEMPILYGSKNLLQDGLIAMIYAEVLFAPLYEVLYPPPLIFSYLYEKNYMVYGFYDMSYSKINGNLLQADVLFVHRDVFYMKDK